MTSRGTKARPGWTRRLQTPGWTVVFVALLGASYWQKTIHAHRSLNTWSIVAKQFGVDGWTWPTFELAGRWYAVREDHGSWRLVLERFGTNAVATDVARDPTSVVALDWSNLEECHGLYDPIVYTDGRELELTRADGTPLPAKEVSDLIRALQSTDVKWMVDPDYDIAPWSITPGRATQRRRTVFWPAVVNNTFAAADLVGLLRSLGWVPRTIARHRRAARLARGHCPWCDYDRSASTAGPCPECGRPLTVDDQEPA